jgi:Ca2+-binding RTX toxin-like protein
MHPATCRRVGATAVAIVATAIPCAGAAAKAPRCFGKPATIVGTKDDDKLYGTPRPDVIVGLAGSDVIRGRRHDDRICGKGGNDVLFGGRGNDRLATGPGNNSVVGQQGRDVLQGGSGPDDDADYFDASRSVFATIKDGYARGAGRDRILPGIDELFGSPHDDTLIGDGRGQLLAGFGGDDRLSGGGSNDLLAGGSGNDRIDGGSGAYDVLDDLEFGGPGTSGGVVLDLSRGSERGHGRDRLRRVEGTYGSPGDDRLTGSDGSDILVGDEGDDRISAAAGRDVVEGDSGLDHLDGGAGLDYASAFGSPTGVTIDLGANTITGADPSVDSDTLSNIEDAQGSTHDDTIIGDDGPNALRGDIGGDTLSGAAGDDVLVGGCLAPEPHFFYEDVFDCGSREHPDSLDGGSGEDRCGDAATIVACEGGVKGGG